MYFHAQFQCTYQVIGHEAGIIRKTNTTDNTKVNALCYISSFDSMDNIDT